MRLVSWRHTPLNSEKRTIDTWLVKKGEDQYLYIPWPKTYLIRLSKTAVSEIYLHKQNNVVNDTVSEVITLIGKPEESERESYDDCTIMTLGVSNRCNLRCRYCYIGSNRHDDSHYTPTRAIEIATEHVAQNALKKGVISLVHFQGAGEPTADSDQFIRVFKLIEGIFRRVGSKVLFSITTNGAFSDDALEIISNNFHSVSLSFDGPKDIQDFHRPLCDGNGSFDIVYKNAKSLLSMTDEGNLTLGFRCTVSNISVDRLQAIHVFFLEHFPNVHVMYEPLSLFGSALDDLELTDPNKDTFIEQIIKLSEEFDYDLSNYSACGILGQVKTQFCKSLGIPTVNIDEHGRLIACQGYGMSDVAFYEYGRYDDVADTFEIDHERINTFRNISVFNYPECRSCLAKYHCAGECLELRRRKAKRCKINRRAVEKTLLLTLEQLKKGEQHG